MKENVSVANVNIPCVCVGCNIMDRANPSFVLELQSLDTGQTFIKFISVTKTSKGFFSVKSNSYFAKIYRLSAGYVSNSRFSKASQLLRHLDGIEFNVTEYKLSKDKNNSNYFKAISINPTHPIYDYRWTKTGVILGKKAQSISRNRNGIEMEQDWNANGIDVESNWNQTGMGLEQVWNESGMRMEWEEPPELPETLGLDDDLNSYSTYPLSSNNISSMSYQVDTLRKHGETDEQYQDRIIDSSFLQGEVL